VVCVLTGLFASLDTTTASAQRTTRGRITPRCPAPLEQKLIAKMRTAFPGANLTRCSCDGCKAEARIGFKGTFSAATAYRYFISGTMNTGKGWVRAPSPASLAALKKRIARLEAEPAVSGFLKACSKLRMVNTVTVDSEGLQVSYRTRDWTRALNYVFEGGRFELDTSDFCAPVGILNRSFGPIASLRWTEPVRALVRIEPQTVMCVRVDPVFSVIVFPPSKPGKRCCFEWSSERVAT